MIQKLLQRVFKHFDIVKTVDGVQTLYLRRYYLLETRWGNIFLHNICRSDDDPDPHDHPWNFLTILLKGSYIDEAHDFVSKDLSEPGLNGWLDGTGGLLAASYEVPGERSPHLFTFIGGAEVRAHEVVKPLRPKYRPATHVHRVILSKPVWSLVFTGKTFRAWGFVKEDRWVFWRKYLGVWDAGINP